MIVISNVIAHVIGHMMQQLIFDGLLQKVQHLVAVQDLMVIIQQDQDLVILSILKQVHQRNLMIQLV